MSVIQKMMAIAGRFADGTARPIKVGEDGSLHTQGKGEYKYYTKSNPIKLGAFHEFRATGLQPVNIPQLLSSDGSFIGVFDQSIIIDTNFDVPYKLELYVNYLDTESGIRKYAYKVFSIDISEQSKRITLAPETSENLDMLVSRPVIVVPELRMPVDSFELVFNYSTAPTTGEVKIAIARRY